MYEINKKEKKVKKNTSKFHCQHYSHNQFTKVILGQQLKETAVIWGNDYILMFNSDIATFTSGKNTEDEIDEYWESILIYSLLSLIGVSETKVYPRKIWKFVVMIS